MRVTDATAMFDALLAEHAPGWTWTWSRGKVQMGLCQYGPKNLKFSRYLVEMNDRDGVDQVVRHELAHVAAGSKAGHGPVFKAHARRLGVRNPGPCTTGLAAPEGAYKAKCPTHGVLEGSRHKMTYAAFHNRVCRRCRQPIIWFRTDGKRIVVPRPPAPRRRRTRRYSYR